MTLSDRVGYAVSPADGSPIYYRLTEPATDARSPAAILCDGIGCDGYVWKYLRPLLASERRTIHWHYRGHGRTPEPRDSQRLSIADLADDLACVLDDTDTADAVLLGHSMGVQVVLETYRRHPDRVRGIVLMCGAPAHPLRTFKGRATLDQLLPAVRRTVGRTPRLFRRVSRTLLPTRLSFEIAKRFEVNPELIDERDFMPYLRGLSKVDPSLFLTMLAEAGRHSATELLPEIGVPALIIAGARDGFTPADLSIEMSEAIPNAQLLMIDDGSHTAPIERPELVNDTVIEFIEHRVNR
jgi:pimeloyl-ACP methyl ester carboxylesterase